jgi:uncharacterized repeat protein (TIGR01451 family)
MMTFMPEPGFVGTPAPLAYIVHDDLGQVVASTYTPTVMAPAPSASAPSPQVVPPAQRTRITITTTASRPVMRAGQTTVITLRVRNAGRTTARRTVTRAPIPKGFAVAKRNGGIVRGGYISFRLGDIAVGKTRVRTYTLIATRSGAGRTVPLMGRAAGTNVRPVKDPTRLRVIADPVRAAAVTG